MLNYNSPTEIRSTLNQLGLRLQKRWGQNFLINRGARMQIASLVEAKGHEIVWEIGPGLGTLTDLLLPEVKTLVAFEIDRGLIRYLQDTFAGRENFRLVPGDVLKTWRSCYREQGSPQKIVGNLPYSCASALIAGLAEQRVAASRIVFLVQRELAQRMNAEPGGKNYSSFSVLCQVAYDVSERMQLKPRSFYPAPEVHSSVVVLEPNTQAQQVADWSFFLRCLRALFRSRRKTMRNNLLGGTIIPPGRIESIESVFRELGIDPGWRSERLSPPELLRLSQHLAALQDR